MNDVGTQVSFRMNVKHHNNEDWNFYQSTEAGDDPVVVIAGGSTEDASNTCEILNEDGWMEGMIVHYM